MPSGSFRSALIYISQRRSYRMQTCRQIKSNQIKLKRVKAYQHALLASCIRCHARTLGTRRSWSVTMAECDSRFDLNDFDPGIMNPSIARYEGDTSHDLIHKPTCVIVHFASDCHHICIQNFKMMLAISRWRPQRIWAIFASLKNEDRRRVHMCREDGWSFFTRLGCTGHHRALSREFKLIKRRNLSN
jgi:hypothetical protein